MIRIKQDGKNIQRISGNQSECMAFYIFWQNKLWSDWVDNLENNKTLTNQVRNLITELKYGNYMLLSYNGKQFEEALEYAIDRCKKLEIEIITE